jgi:hypothetical protein
MPAFRLLNYFPVYLGDDGLPLAGGYLRFYDSGTTTPKDIYGDQALTINNGPEVELDATGRAVHDLWGDGNYRVRLYASDDTLVGEVDNVELPGGDAATIPALVDGYFLTNNGALLLWAPVRQLPDPTGQDGKMVVADGDGYILQPQPTPPDIPDPDIVIQETAGVLAQFLAGNSTDPDKLCIQAGRGSAPASGLNTTSTPVVYPSAFDATPFLAITPTVAAAGAGGFLPVDSLIAESGTGFTVKFDTNGGDEGNSAITNAITFSWIAIGVRTP